MKPNDLNIYTLSDLKTNTEYTWLHSNVIHWFWEVVEGLNKEDMATQ